MPLVRPEYQSDPLIDTLARDIAARWINRRIYSPGMVQLKIIVANLFGLWLEGNNTRCGFALRADAYVFGADLYDMGLRRSAADLLSELMAGGGVLAFKGLKKWRDRPATYSQFLPSPEMVEIFEAHMGVGAEEFGQSFGDSREVIVLRDTDKRDMVIDLNDCPDDIRHRDRVLRDANRLLASTVISMADGSDPDITKSLVSIFNADFGHGGRIYTGAQGLSSKDRNMILLDGQQTVEMDYGSVHLALLYSEAGVLNTMSMGDLYARDDLTVWCGGEKVQARKIMKSLINIAINAPNKRAAMGAFRAEGRKNTRKHGRYNQDSHLMSIMTNNEIDIVFEMMCNSHPLIADKIASGAGKRLQKVDSDVAMRIIKHFTAKGVACLPIHDSFIVPICHADELERVMRDAIREVAGVAGIRIARQDGIAHQYDEIDLLAA